MLALLLYLTVAPAHPVIGDHAPSVSLSDLDGEPVILSANEPVAVVFFATWCEPCHAAVADLLAIHEVRGGFRILLVAVGEDAVKVHAFLEKRTLARAVTVALDPTARAARAWGQDRFPTTFLVDGNQIIRHINRGYGRGFRVRVARWLRAMVEPG
jgi:thiol-disulfide isomerase/thioredoxin